jgi:hypothetical protein
VASVPHQQGEHGQQRTKLNAKLSLRWPCTCVGECSYAVMQFIIPVLDGGGWQAHLPGRFTYDDRAPCMHCVPIWTLLRKEKCLFPVRDSPACTHYQNSHLCCYSGYAQATFTQYLFLALGCQRCQQDSCEYKHTSVTWAALV